MYGTPKTHTGLEMRTKGKEKHRRQGGARRGGSSGKGAKWGKAAWGARLRGMKNDSLVRVESTFFGGVGRFYSIFYFILGVGWLAPEKK